MKILLSVLIAAMAAVIVFAAFGSPGGPAWFHVAGMAASVLVLALIWVYPGIDQPRRPPP